MKKAALFLFAAALMAGVLYAQEAPPVEEVTGADEPVKEKDGYQRYSRHL